VQFLSSNSLDETERMLKNEPVRAPSRTHADVELEQAGGKLEYV